LFSLALLLPQWLGQNDGRDMETRMDGNGGRGTEKGADAGEAGGRGSQTVYTCINCGAQNYVDPNWSWFTCWKCNLQKPLPLPGH
jgi:hypothetical protein